MFDKLVVSEPEKADQPSRRKYFMVSSVVMGGLFLAAIVISIFAADYGLGSGSFELTELMAPAEFAVAPEPIQKQSQTSHSSSSNELPSRKDNIQNINETPSVLPGISTAQNTSRARPIDGRYTSGRFDSDPSNPGGTGRETIAGSTGHPEGLNSRPATEVIPEDGDPPPAQKKVVRPRPVVSKGVINGIAQNLPKPEYSAAARAVGAQGRVNVQVTISETGAVISANAVDGHALLRPAAENAARKARFTPTILSDTAVKVTGVIVYNFVR
jgi:TonB family protein